MSIAKSVLQSEKWMTTANEIADITTDYWFECRSILKKNNFSKYYNCIPAIIRRYCYFKEKIVYTQRDYALIMETFKQFQKAFASNKHGRKYFPNLRYIALKIMAHHKIPLQYPIPFLITKTKIKPLNDLFTLLISDQCSTSTNLALE
jgi:hypothetical protein